MKRNLQFVIRNPQGLRALLIVSIFQSFLMSSIFQDVGTQRIWDFKDINKFALWKRKKIAIEYANHNKQVAKDYNGFVFFCASDQFISIAVSQVLQMPEMS